MEQLLLSPETEAQRKELPKSLLLVDLETTGLNPKNDQVIELAASLFDVEHRSVVASTAFLLPCEANAAESINRIPASLTRVPSPWRTGLVLLNELLATADALVAHNASFDSRWFGIDRLPNVWQPWLCSMVDFEWGSRGAKSLRDLAINHGVTVARAHRALADVDLLANVLACREDLEELLEGAVAAKVTVVATVSYERRNEAKNRGFSWNGIARRWEKRMRPEVYANSSFPFRTFVLREG